MYLLKGQTENKEGETDWFGFVLSVLVLQKEKVLL